MYFTISWWMSALSILIPVIGSFMLINKINKRIQKGQTSQESLLKNEQVQIWIFSLLNPILTCLIVYFGFKKRFPIKAKKSAVIAACALGIWFVFNGLSALRG